MDTIQPVPIPETTRKGQRERGRYAAAERRKQALELRKSGATYQVIADQLGYKTRDSARKAIYSALKDITRESAEDVRTLEIARLDALMLALWPKARQGNETSVDRILRIMERRAKLIGLDSPTKIAPTTPDGQGEWIGKADSDLVDEFKRLVAPANAGAGRSDTDGTEAAAGDSGADRVQN